jgi:hypothetical protein
MQSKGGLHERRVLSGNNWTCNQTETAHSQTARRSVFAVRRSRLIADRLGRLLLALGVA